MRLLLKIGGSAISSSMGTLNTEVIDFWIETIDKLINERYKLGVVIGGGIIARKYISIARKLGLSEFLCDVLGINVARLNARLFLFGLLSSNPNKNIKIFPGIVESPQMAFEVINSYDVFFAGGLIPGQSTMGVAAELAEAIGADYLLVATNVDGIYNRDPRIDKGAKRIRAIKITDLVRMFMNNPNLAGTYALFDQQSLLILKRSQIPTVIFNGTKKEAVEGVINCLKKRENKCFEDFGSVIIFE